MCPDANESESDSESSALLLSPGREPGRVRRSAAPRLRSSLVWDDLFDVRESLPGRLSGDAEYQPPPPLLNLVSASSVSPGNLDYHKLLFF